MGNRLQKSKSCSKRPPNALFCLLGAVVFPLRGVYFYQLPYRTVEVLAAQHNEQR